MLVYVSNISAAISNILIQTHNSKSDHSYYSHHAPLTASQRLQTHKENALTERARWNRRARLVTSIVL